ncbi:glycosyltransferase [Massilia sp. RP-1-19]|uniref:Glycosyltransferase n=2 Tax=Massilia polaris TaxID=2728846 RepID=A0A848HET5_9BURK|nr:glycosyltransferase [Massilia polaris]
MATCNGALTLPKVLAAYARLEHPGEAWKLFVVNDGSTDGTGAILAGFAAALPLTVIDQDRKGKNAALNAALAVALANPGCQLLVFTDDDATPEPDWLMRLADCARAQPGYAIFGGAIYPDWAVAPPDWVLNKVPLGITYAVTTAASGPVFPGLVWGANMAVRRAVFDAGHRFNASIGPSAGAYAMGSETEFNRRVSEAGFKSWFCAEAKTGHHIRASQLAPEFILQRAYKFGRGARAQETGSSQARLFDVPRWTLSKYAHEMLAALKARLAGDQERLFAARWELHYLRGYFFQAWKAKGQPRVMLTSCSGELGGMEMRMAQEARLLAAAGARVVVATPPFRGFERFADALHGGRIAVGIFDPPQFGEQWQWRRFNKLRASLTGTWQMRRHRPDLVHVAFCWTTYGASALWLAHRCGIPTVISVHNAFPKKTFSAWHDRLFREAFTSVKGIYAVSDSAMDHFVAIFGKYIGPATRLQVIPNSVDIGRFIPSPARRDAARARLGLPRDALVLGSVARLSPQKRPDALIDLFARLRQTYPDLYLVLAGTGPLEQQLRDQVAALGLDGAVIFAGFVGDVEMMLPAFDLHFLLSRNEGFGISTIEAMACGVPVVGTDVPGTADILRGSEGGMLVPLDDADLTHDQVSRLLADPARRAAMAIKARQEMESTYSAEILKGRIDAFYQGLLT